MDDAQLRPLASANAACCIILHVPTGTCVLFHVERPAQATVSSKIYHLVQILMKIIYLCRSWKVKMNMLEYAAI